MKKILLLILLFIPCLAHSQRTKLETLDEATILMSYSYDTISVNDVSTFRFYYDGISWSDDSTYETVIALHVSYNPNWTFCSMLNLGLNNEAFCLLAQFVDSLPNIDIAGITYAGPHGVRQKMVDFGIYKNETNSDYVPLSAGLPDVFMIMRKIENINILKW